MKLMTIKLYDQSSVSILIYLVAKKFYQDADGHPNCGSSSHCYNDGIDCSSDYLIV
jgi:hypothetical protein